MASLKDVIGAFRIPASVLVTTSAIFLILGMRIMSAFYDLAISVHDVTVYQTEITVAARFMVGVAIMLPIANAIPGLIAGLIASFDHPMREAIRRITPLNLAFYCITMPIIGLAIGYAAIFLMPMPGYMSFTRLMDAIDIAIVSGSLIAQLPYAASLMLKRMRVPTEAKG